jgi:hypothetical protein
VKGASIDAEWLRARGGLHDARVVSVREVHDVTLIEIDDEWANQFDDKDPSRAGVIRLEGAVLMEGSWQDARGGWISELSFNDVGLLQLDFCDSDPVLVQISRVSFEGVPNPAPMRGLSEAPER